jgi:hypothetical protein
MHDSEMFLRHASSDEEPNYQVARRILTLLLIIAAVTLFGSAVATAGETFVGIWQCNLPSIEGPTCGVVPK